MGSGLELCRRFYFEVVRPMVDVPHSAALLGRGSEVLGFDDEMSADHNCEARALVFVADGVELRLEVPETFEGRPALVEVHTVRGYFLDQLGSRIRRYGDSWSAGRSAGSSRSATRCGGCLIVVSCSG